MPYSILEEKNMSFRWGFLTKSFGPEARSTKCWLI